MSVGAGQQLVLVSKAHKQSVRQLYKMIFKLHKSLPSQMRELGDKYVRNEFKLHKTASPEHTKVFLTEWMVSLYFLFFKCYPSHLILKYPISYITKKLIYIIMLDLRSPGDL